MKYLQMYRAAICIQTAFRRYAAQRHYKLLKAVIIMTQANYRASVVRQKVEKVFKAAILNYTELIKHLGRMIEID